MSLATTSGAATGSLVGDAIGYAAVGVGANATGAAGSGITIVCGFDFVTGEGFVEAGPATTTAKSDASEAGDADTGESSTSGRSVSTFAAGGVGLGRLTTTNGLDGFVKPLGRAAGFGEDASVTNTPSASDAVGRAAPSVGFGCGVAAATPHSRGMPRGVDPSRVFEGVGFACVTGEVTVGARRVNSWGGAAEAGFGLPTG